MSDHVQIVTAAGGSARVHFIVIQKLTSQSIQLAGINVAGHVDCQFIAAAATAICDRSQLAQFSCRHHSRHNVLRLSIDFEQIIGGT